MGPVLPFLYVFGKHLGVSEIVTGLYSGVQPILVLIAKPIFGLFADYFQEYRKTLFMGLLCVTNVCLACVFFIPQPSGILTSDLSSYNFSNIHCDNVRSCEDWEVTEADSCGNYKRLECNWTYGSSSNMTHLEDLLWTPSFGNGLHPDSAPCIVQNAGSLSCNSSHHKLSCQLHWKEREKDCVYGTLIFWGYILLTTVGTVGYSVANSINDAICFDILGDDGQINYGYQRLWGTLGFGITALLAGFAIDWWSGDDAAKNYVPGSVLVIVFAFMDIMCCMKLKLPPVPKSGNILQDVGKLLSHKHIAIFLVFATLGGVVDSFIIIFFFWYLEDLAQITGDMNNIKLIQGLTVAVQCLFGETLFFMLSGKILKKIGYGHSLTLCLMIYSIRIGLLALIPSPWWVLPIELLLSGPTYALFYTTVVAYASAIAPPGASATMQGVAAGMDDGFGYAIGILICGVLYQKLGGNITIIVFSATSFLCGLLHFILYETSLKHAMLPAGHTSDVKCKPPVDADGSEQEMAPLDSIQSS